MIQRFSKIALVTFIPLSFFSLVSCNQKTYFTSAKKIAPYFHEIVYNDFEEDKDLETVNHEGLSKADFGCTSVRNGKFYGRNFDYYYSNSPSILVKMKGNENRFKSVGIANHTGITDSELVNYETSKNSQHDINIIPNFMTDGINENGVACNINVVDGDDGGGLIEHTNLGKPRLLVEFALRYILDNATSAAHAVELLKDRDIFVNEKNNTTVHIMVADKNETYIIEFIKSKKESDLFELRAEKKTGDKQIMTNFFNNMTDEEEKATYTTDPSAYLYGYNNNAGGTERYEFVKKNYKDCATFYGMWSVLHDIRFSQMYLNPNKPDYPSEDFSQEEIKAAGEWKEGPELEKYRSVYNFTRFILDTGRRDLGYVGDTWITMHNAIYNIEEKTLSLNVQENYSNTYTYDLNF